MKRFFHLIRICALFSAIGLEASVFTGCGLFGGPQIIPSNSSLTKKQEYMSRFRYLYNIPGAVDAVFIGYDIYLITQSKLLISYDSGTSFHKLPAVGLPEVRELESIQVEGGLIVLKLNVRGARKIYLSKDSGQNFTSIKDYFAEPISGFFDKIQFSDSNIYLQLSGKIYYSPLGSKMELPFKKLDIGDFKSKNYSDEWVDFEVRDFHVSGSNVFLFSRFELIKSEDDGRSFKSIPRESGPTAAGGSFWNVLQIGGFDLLISTSGQTYFSTDDGKNFSEFENIGGSYSLAEKDGRIFAVDSYGLKVLDSDRKRFEKIETDLISDTQWGRIKKVFIKDDKIYLLTTAGLAMASFNPHAGDVRQ